MVKPITTRKGFQYFARSRKVPGAASPFFALRAASICDCGTDSIMPRRIHITVTAAKAPITKGIRQPQSCRASALNRLCRMICTIKARTWPLTRVTYWKLEKNPRRFLVAISDM